MASHALPAYPPQPRREERIGLGIAVALHVALAAFLVTSDPPRPAVLSEERMVVNLSEEIGLQDTAPVPVPESRAAVAPELSRETTSPPEPEVAPPLPPLAQPATEPPPSRSAPRATVQPRAVPQPRTQPQPRGTPQPRSSPAARATSTPAPRARQAAQQRQAASRIGSDFLAGAGNADTQETRAPANRAGPQALAGIRSAITRQIKPHWSAPQGVDAEKLVTILAFSLNEDGTLNGRPRVVSQSGATDANAAQKALHAERAIRAVTLAAPFDLPRDLYSSWRTINNARFDRSLSQ